MNGAIAMLLFIIVLSNAGGLYFWFKDKKEAKHGK